MFDYPESFLHVKGCELRSVGVRFIIYNELLVLVGKRVNNDLNMKSIRSIPAKCSFGRSPKR